MRMLRASLLGRLLCRIGLHGWYDPDAPFGDKDACRRCPAARETP